MTADINIKTDAALKKQAERLFAGMGMSLSAAMNIFLRRSVEENGMPFEITADEPSAETVAAMEDVKAGRNMSRAFSSMEDLAASLNV